MGLFATKSPVGDERGEVSQAKYDNAWKGSLCAAGIWFGIAICCLIYEVCQRFREKAC